MATYNGEAYVAEQLQSILENLQLGDEIVIVDDCSADSTITTCLSVLEDEQFRDFRIVQSPKNQGHISSFRKAISLATRPFVALSDQDDIWPSGRLDLLATMLEREGTDLVFGSLETFGVRTARLPNPDLRLQGLRGLTTLLLAHFDIPRKLYSYGSACAFRKSAVDLRVPIRTETHETWLAGQALAGRGVIFTANVVTRRRLHATNITRRRSFPRRARGLIETYWNLFRTLREAKRLRAT